jgi:hypothetical protein
VRLLTSERRLDAQGVSSALPRQVRDVLNRRLERLPEQTVALLTVAAVAGGVADVELLGRVTGLDADAVVDGCEPALVVGLLVEDAGLPDGFSVSHDLVRQTIEESLSTARRLRLHAKIAAAIEARGDLTPQQIVDVAHHFCVAAPVVGPAAAIPYLAAASEDAISRFAYDRAEQNLAVALDLARQVRDPAQRAGLEREVQGRLAIFLAYVRGRIADIPSTNRARLDAPTTEGESTAAWLGTAIMTGAAGNAAATAALAEDVLSRAATPVAAVAAHFALGWAHFVGGRLLLADHELSEVESAMAAHAGHIPGLFASVEVTTPGYAALILHSEGDEQGADARMEVAAARAAGSDIGAINLALLHCRLAGMRGDVEAAVAGARTCTELSQRLGFPLFGLQARLVRGWAEALSGDKGGAACADAAYDDYCATGVRFFLPLYLLLRAEAYASTGNSRTAARLVVESRAVSAELGDVCLSPRLTAFADALVPRAS